MSKRTFESLRPQTTAPIVSEQQEPIESRARRLFRTGQDGPAVLAWLLERAQTVTPPGASNDTLREAEGARRFIAAVVRDIDPSVR